MLLETIRFCDDPLLITRGLEASACVMTRVRAVHSPIVVMLWWNVTTDISMLGELCSEGARVRQLLPVSPLPLSFYQTPPIFATKSPQNT